MSDRFSSFQPSLSGPASSGFAIVPNDASDLAEATRGLYVGQGGDITTVMLSGQQVVLKNLATGTLLPIRVQRVLATGTTASHLVALL